MNINPASLGHLYNKVGSLPAAYSEAVAPVRGKEAASAAKVDTVSISTMGNTQREVGKIAGGIMRDLSLVDNSARVEAISQAVENGSYYVPAGAVADAILQHVLGE